MTNQTRGFYALVGPILSRREIVSELGAPVWDDDDKTWFIAMKDGQLAGLLSASIRPSGTHLSSVYIRPEHRRSGLMRRLIASCAAEFALPFSAVVPNASAPAYEALGFEPTRVTKNFQTMVRPK